MIVEIMEFIDLDQQSRSLVDNVGFKLLLNYLDPRYVHQGCKYFTDVCLLDLYQTVYEHIKNPF